ncbi:LysR family transcriptional regulator [Caballeronia terrestris]|uniref:LysR family transcriptional regulator n=1 Tax=Caballeronia terrestris TaxID=1226301 RepID=A0A158KRY8_9BURK|nr:LysR family transcriptional regulator [Caballeronia terrestris]SAL83844.1 LysR family transcriptional regulator [Caballeronia terrestris]
MELTSINDIIAFVSVVESGSFTLAAKKLGLTRSGVGKRIVHMEQRLQTRLFQRTTRSLRLTDDGQVLYDRSSQILEDLQEIDTAMARRTGEPRGQLTLSLPVTLGRRHVLPVLKRFLEKWPEVNATVSFSDRFVDLIEDGIDIAIRTGEPREDSRLLARVVARQKSFACASPSYLIRKGVPNCPEELVNHDCLFFLSEGRPRPWSFSIDGKPWSYAGKARLLMDDGEALQAASRSGFGVAFLPTYLTGEDLRAGRLVPLFESYSFWDEPIRAVYPSKRYLSPKVRSFIDMIADEWALEPPWEVITEPTS